MKPIAFYSGKIETKNRECFVGDQKVDCPGSQTKTYTQTGDKLDILPPITTLDKRNDFIFTSVLLLVILSFLLLVIFRTKIFGKTLGEYIKPIWYFILLVVAVVFWQYMVGITLEGDLLQLRMSQIIWELAVGLSVYKLSKMDFGYGNIFFVGVLYSLFIHGLKVSIRYFFYAKTLLYSLDRFLYGSLLVMAVTVLGFVFVYLKRKGVRY